MKKRILALLTVAALAAGLSGCGNKKPDQYDIEVEGPSQTSSKPATSSASQSEEQDDDIKWVVEPRKDLEIAYSLADYNKLESLSNQAQLAFFGQNGGMGVIDLTGNIVIPSKENVVWCPRCGITSKGEEKTFDGTGAVTGSGGHGGMLLDLYYDIEQGVLYRDDIDVLVREESGYSDKVRAVRCAKLVDVDGDLDGEFSGWALEDWDSGRHVDTELLGKWVLLGMDGKLIGNGAQYDEVLGVVDPQSDVPLTETPAQDGMIAVKQKGQWSFLWENGQAGPGPYQEVRPFEGDVAAVKTQEGWGFIDRSGKQLTPMTFLGAASAYNGRAWVKTDAGWGVIELAQNPAKA